MYRQVNKHHPDYAAMSAAIQEGVENFAAPMLTQGLPFYVDKAVCKVAQALTSPNGTCSHFSLATCGPLIVGYNIEVPWWGDRPLLIEEFILRYKPGSLLTGMEDLHNMALDYGAKGIVIGDLALLRSETKGYARLLRAAGYKESANQYFKDLSNG